MSNKVKYKCLDCGHKFEGDLSTTDCPVCGSQDIKKDPGMPSWIWQVCIGVVVLVTIGLCIKTCQSPQSMTGDYYNENNAELRITINGVDNKDLKAKYKIVMNNDSDSQTIDYYFNGNNNTITIDVNGYDYQFVSGVTYTFSFIERKTNQCPDGFRWNGGHSYYHPFPPVAPKIRVSKQADCNTNTYTITINIVEGEADKFYLDEQESQDSVFYNVSPRQEMYNLKAYDSSNKLSSEISTITCKPIHRFQINESDINRILSDVAQRKVRVGDALEKINNNNDIKLSKPIDGNSTLEGALDYAYNQKIKYHAQVSITHEDCNDRIISITLTR